MSTTFNIFDLVFIAFTLIFVFTAFLRGFVKEIFSLFVWVVALTASYFLTPYVAKFFASNANKMVLDIAVRSVIFILRWPGSNPPRLTKNKMPKIFDRSLGILYGFIKTLLIFGLFYSAVFNSYRYLLGKEADDKRVMSQMPHWLKDAKSHGMIKMTADMLDPIMVAFISSVTKNLEKVMPNSKELNKKIDEVIEEKIEKVKPTESMGITNEPNSGYSKKDIQKMDRLIEIIDKK